MSEVSEAGAGTAASSRFDESHPSAEVENPKTTTEHRSKRTRTS